VGEGNNYLEVDWIWLSWTNANERLYFPTYKRNVTMEELIDQQQHVDMYTQTDCELNNGVKILS